MTKQAQKENTMCSYTSVNGRNVLHNWDGPALISGEKEEYYIFGVKISKNEWEKNVKLKKGK